MSFVPRLDILPEPQQAVWRELGSVPPHFTLYGGTAIALQLGHRQSVDFDFLAAQPIDPIALARDLPTVTEADRATLIAAVRGVRTDALPVIAPLEGGA